MNTENIQKIVKYASNQRKVAKHSLSYYIGMMDHYNTKNIFGDSYKRSEVLAEFIRLIQEEKYYNRIIQANTIKNLLNLN